MNIKGQFYFWLICENTLHEKFNTIIMWLGSLDDVIRLD